MSKLMEQCFYFSMVKPHCCWIIGIGEITDEGNNLKDIGKDKYKQTAFVTNIIHYKNCTEHSMQKPKENTVK